MPLTTSKQMLAQTAAEGTKAFAGSSYDTVKPTTPTITAASLAPQTPIQPVQTEQPQVPVVSPYTLTADETQAETQETDLNKLIAGLTAETSTPFQEDARLKAEEAQGISAKKSALAGLQNTQKSLLTESQGIQLQLQQDIQNQQNLAQQGGANVTKGGLAPQTRALQTVANQSLLQNAIKQYGNNASLAAAQGDLASAMDYVDRAIQAEFLPKEKALAVAQANLTNLQKSGTLTRAQQKRADERQALIDAQKAALAEEKAIKTDTRDAVVKAISNNTGLPGFDNLDIAALQAAKSPEEVAAILQARGLSVASQADQLDMKVKQAQLDKANYDLAHPNRQTQVIQGNNGNTLLIDTNTGETIKDYGSKELAPSDASGTMPVTIDGQTFEANADLVAYAQKYAAGENVSPAELKLAGITMGQVAELAKALPKPNGTLIDNNTGVKPKTLSPTQEAGITAMNEIVTQTMPALQDRFGKIATGVLGGLGGMVWTSQDRQDYDTFRQEFLSKLLVARSGAAVTEQEYERYAKMLPSNFNQMFFLGSDGGKKLKSLSSSMQTNLDNLTKTQQVSIVGYSDVKEELSKLSPEQKAELEKEGLLPAWAK